MKARFSDVRSSDMPDDLDLNSGWIIKRAPTSGVLRLAVYSEKWKGIRTHYINNRTIPCLKDMRRCEGCQSKMDSRWKGYLLCANTANGQQTVLEFTPPAVIPLATHFAEYKTIRGCLIVVGRARDRSNGKVQIEIKETRSLAPNKWMDQPIWPVLAKIWKISAVDINDLTSTDNDVHLGRAA